MKVLISGGSGFIGRHLVASLVQDGHEVVVLTRRPETTNPQKGARYVAWDPRIENGEWVKEVAGAAGVVNLAGTSIGSWPWTRQKMAELLSSRLSATATLVKALERTPVERRPPVLVSASGIDYYGDRGDEAITEESTAGGSFLAQLSELWEAEAERAQPLGVRVVRIRTAMVFGREASAFRLLTLPFRLFVGGPLGNGRQWFTWIHIDDIVGLYRLALEDSRVTGPVNAVAPDVRREREVAREIGRVLRRPSLIFAPAFALKLVLGKMAQVLLHGRRAQPAKARDYGYQFRFGGLHDALEDILLNR
jgi:uncharacterized protein